MKDMKQKRTGRRAMNLTDGRKKMALGSYVCQFDLKNRQIQRRKIYINGFLKHCINVL